MYSARLGSSRSNNSNYSSNSNSRQQPMSRRQCAVARVRLPLHKRRKPVQPGGAGRADTVMAGLRRQQADTVKSRGRLRARTRRIA